MNHHFDPPLTPRHGVPLAGEGTPNVALGADSPVSDLYS